MIVKGTDGVLVQGITGTQGQFWSERMKECGTRIVAGVSPGKGGREVGGVPVYSSVHDAAAEHDIAVSVLFVPPLAAKSAALEALQAGVSNVVVLTEHVPYHDIMEVLAEAEDRGARVLGPNTAGLVVPGEASVGIMPGFASNIFQPGSVGIVSRSGSLGTLMALHVVRAGQGQSAFLGIGGDPILGTTITDAVRILDRDPRTDVIVIVGEIGGSMEEDAAEHIASIDKPVIAFIAGRSAPAGKRMGHAGALVTGNRGSGRSKVEALTEAGAHVVEVPTQIGDVLRGRARVRGSDEPPRSRRDVRPAHDAEGAPAVPKTDNHPSHLGAPPAHSG
ncbi:MAG: succinyl-CoA synthetase subunit alpha [Actinobacteria bacterium]|nr:succinyl-CoA synthetase subunit alpha [Actinomycetota bacterium]